MLLFLTLILAASVAQAQDVPKRKSGLWEVERTTVRTEGKPSIVQMCIDEASDNAIRQLAEGTRNETCKTDKVRREGDQLIVDAVCNLGKKKATATTHAVITGKFDSAYKIESKSTYDPPMHGKAEGSSVLEARWLGACKPDQRPGDYIHSNGLKLRASEPEKSPDEKAAARAQAKQGPDTTPGSRKQKPDTIPGLPGYKAGSMPVPTK
jgi:hypothetical protein